MSEKSPFQRKDLEQLSKETLIDLLLESQLGFYAEPVSEILLRSMLESTQQSLTLITPESTVLAFNRLSAENARLVFGKEIYPGQSIYEFVLPEDQANFAAAMNQVLAGENYWELKSFQDLQGQIQWFEFNLSPVRNIREQMIGVCMTTQLRTELMSARQNLQNSQERLQLALKSARMGICEWDLVRGTMMWDEQLLQLYGDHAFSRVSSFETWFACIHAEDRERVRSEFQHLLESESQREQLEFRIVRPNGETAWIHASALIEKDAQGQICRILGMQQDISAQKGAEEKLLQALQEKDVLLRELYHRTKNNLQVICAMLGLQAMVEVEPRFCQQLQDLENRIHAMALVHQMLYRSEHLSRLNLKEYLMQLGALLLESYRADERQISLAHHCDDVFVLMDVAMPCGLIFAELLANIFKHAFVGRSQGVISHALCVDGDELFWEIADNGIGLSENFDPEVQGNMGLQTTLVLIEQQLQGQFRLNSSEQGTCWRIHFSKNLYSERI